MVRVPIIPGITDSQTNIGAIGRLVSGLKSVERLDLLPYHTSAEGKYNRLGKKYDLVGLDTPGDTSMSQLAHILEGFGLYVNIGG